jgi:hypothetical protein
LFGFALTGALSIAGAAACSTSGGSGTPAASGGAYCSALADFARRCAPDDACTQAFVQDCAAVTSVSEAYREAITACAPYNDCDGGTEIGGASECIWSRIGATTPTVAQTNVKNDFCARCPDGASAPIPQACSRFFEGWASNDGSASLGIGIFVLSASDAIATEIDRQCVGLVVADSAVGDCANAFFLCSLGS